MTFKDLASKLNNTVQTVPNLIQVLKDGFQNVEAGSSGVTYSTTEFDTGEKWIEGKTIYGKRFTDVDVNYGEQANDLKLGLKADKIIKIELMNTATQSGHDYYLGNYYAQVDIGESETDIRVISNLGNYPDISVLVTYTKPAGVIRQVFFIA